VTDSIAETVLKRDRMVLLSGLAILTLLCWGYLITMPMPHALHMHAWTAGDLGFVFVMWTVMMVAMMAPSASPMVLTFGAMNRRRLQARKPYVSATVFFGGYLAVWTAFSGLAALGQWGLHRAALLSHTMAASSPLLAGGLLVTAGIFQWTPLKDACLRHCRSPLAFMIAEWRNGTGGAFHMGIRHGIYCLGCCWFLMLLPFAAGVMNLLWMAALTVFILVEKAVPAGDHIGRVAGVLLVLAGGALLVSGWAG
jgi:predicted metal-binding membrane protein